MQHSDNYTLGHTSCPLAELSVSFWVHLGVAKWLQNGKKSKNTCFLEVSDHFSLKNGPNDLVKGLYLSLDIGQYVLPACGPLCTFLGLFGAAQSAPK
jgi:hypothetical protein